ncbi:hypothetical protein [Pumilibacter intestinalis]|uniref:hypothetical protein n=1 Tax=Pumilibacter intestinalis TaxID=2941511 RepID=UPI00203B0E30|nr:hypothetical protein [Pumilibacter intestinalis]
MKKAASIIAALLLPLLFASAPLAYADSSVVYLYIRTDAVLSSVSGEEICVLPATYFAVAEGDAQNGKYPVSYLDLRGYVSAQNVEITDYEPVTKFAVRSATPNNDGMAVNLRDAPNSQTGKVLCAVPAGAKLALYGPRNGGELFAGAGNLWQYVRYDSPSGAVYGYVYAPQLSYKEVTPNVIEKVEKPSTEAEQTPGSSQISSVGNILLIAALCVPAGVIMLVLFYRPESKRTPRHGMRRE